MITAENHAPMWTQFLVKVNFKNLVLPIEKFPFLVLARDKIMLQHLIIHFSLHYLPSGRLREVGKFQTFSSESGRGHLREVVNTIQYNTIQ